jgi:F0F1-type ATP synthase membrane subunit b/b'
MIIFINYIFVVLCPYIFLVTKQKKKQRNTKKAKRKNKETQKKQKDKTKKRKKLNKKKNSVILSLANRTLNSPGIN